MISLNGAYFTLCDSNKCGVHENILLSLHRNTSTHTNMKTLRQTYGPTDIVSWERRESNCKAAFLIQFIARGSLLCLSPFLLPLQPSHRTQSTSFRWTENLMHRLQHKSFIRYHCVYFRSHSPWPYNVFKIQLELCSFALYQPTNPTRHDNFYHLWVCDVVYAVPIMASRGLKPLWHDLSSKRWDLFRPN